MQCKAVTGSIDTVYISMGHSRLSYVVYRFKLLAFVLLGFPG